MLMGMPCAACGRAPDTSPAPCEGASCTRVPSPATTSSPSLPGRPDASLPAPAPSGPQPGPPSPKDGIKNGSETDVDCGGPDASIRRCAAYQSCLAAGDCESALCGATGAATGKCLTAPSCTGGEGTFACGLAGNEDCCTSLPVPGGSYLRQQDPLYPATISPFTLDKYEINVGRIRAYFEAVKGNPKAHAPSPGASAHPRIPASGWRSSFDVRLPSSWQEINERLGAAGCTEGGDNSDGGAASWTPAAGPYEALPITCLDWYTLFGFCAWDGGRLPTDAEWGFAAEGGSEKRFYAWGGPTDFLKWPETHAVLLLPDPAAGDTPKYTYGSPFRAIDPVTGHANDGPAHMSPPGRMIGYGRWGHADLTGNVLEFLLDRTPIPQGQCSDCARVDWADPPQDQVGAYPPQWTTVPEPLRDTDYPDGTRSLRGGSWDVHVPFTFHRYEYRVQRTYYAAGARCARN